MCESEKRTCLFDTETTLLIGNLVNSLAPGKFELNIRYVIFKWILVIDGWGISCESP